MRFSAAFRTHFDGRELLSITPHQYNEAVASLNANPNVGAAVEGMFFEKFPSDLAARVPTLRSLSVLHMRSPVDVNALYDFQQLEGLEARLRDLNAAPELARLPHLRSVFLPWSKPLTPQLKSAANQLRELGLIDFSPVGQTMTSLAPLNKLERLEILYGNIKSVRGVEKMTSLRSLNLCGTPKLTDMSHLVARAETLDYLSLNGVPSNRKLYDTLARLKNLKTLMLIQQPTPKSLDFVAELPNLTDLRIIGTKLDRKQKAWLRTLPGKPDNWLRI